MATGPIFAKIANFAVFYAKMANFNPGFHRYNEPQHAVQHVLFVAEGAPRFDRSIDSDRKQGEGCEGITLHSSVGPPASYTVASSNGGTPEPGQ